MKSTFTILICLISYYIFAQKPKNGTYTYDIYFAEWRYKSFGTNCTVIIKDDSITVIHNGNKNVSGNQGDLIEQGIIMKHKKSGKWIIAHSPEDAKAINLGGCSEGPTIIDFKRKRILLC